MTRKSRDCQYSSDFNTRSVDAVEQMDVFFSLREFPDFNIIHSGWRRFPLLTHVIFTSISPTEPCILSNVNIVARGVLKELTELPSLFWQHFEHLPGRPLTGITYGPDNAATRRFPSSIQADMDFKDCLTASCFSDQQVTSSLALLIHGPWFSPAHVEVGGGAAYSYLHTGIKLWCAATTNSSSRLLERCFNDVASFIILFQRGPRSREAIFLTFHFQRPGDLIYIPPFRTHLVLTMNNVKPTVLSGWDAVYTRDHSIIKRTLDEYVIGVRRTTWRNILREQGRQKLSRWVYSAATGPQETKEYLQKH